MNENNLRILAFSDIHNNIDVVKKMYSEIKNEKFDFIIFAGDFGKIKNAIKIINIFKPLKIPFLYVQGNWDHFDYNVNIGNRYSQHLHLKAFKANDYTILGYSGTDSNYYRENPTLQKYFKNDFDYDTGKKLCKIARGIREEELKNYIKNNNIDINKLILVGHERIGKLKFKPLIHIFGHIHNSYLKPYRGINYLNVASLDNKSTNNPNYSIIEIKNKSLNVDFIPLGKKKIKKTLFNFLK